MKELIGALGILHLFLSSIQMYTPYTFNGCEFDDTSFTLQIPDISQVCQKPQLSHEKNLPTFHSTGWLIGILIMV